MQTRLIEELNSATNETWQAHAERWIRMALASTDASFGLGHVKAALDRLKALEVRQNLLGDRASTFVSTPCGTAPLARFIASNPSGEREGHWLSPRVLRSKQPSTNAIQAIWNCRIGIRAIINSGMHFCNGANLLVAASFNSISTAWDQFVQLRKNSNCNEDYAKDDGKSSIWNDKYCSVN